MIQRFSYSRTECINSLEVRHNELDWQYKGAGSTQNKSEVNSKSKGEF